MRRGELTSRRRRTHVVWLLVFCGLGCDGPDGAGPGRAHSGGGPQGERLDRRMPGKLASAGDSHQGTLRAGERILYPLDLQAGEGILVEIDQALLDVEVEIQKPDGEKSLAWDTPTHRGAPERFCAIAESSGVHVLAVAPFQGTGSFEIHLVQRRMATERDRLCFRAAKLFQSAQGVELPATISILERAAALWEEADEAFLAALAWREAGSQWRDTGPTSNAVDRLERALVKAREASNPYLEVSVLNRLGLALIDLGELTRARLRLEEAEGRARQADEKWGHASALTNLGLLDDFTGEPHRAIERFSEALPLWRQIGDPVETAQVLHNMAVAYGLLDRHDRALDLLAEARGLALQAGDEGREANILLSRGWIHYLRGQPSEGQPDLERVLEIRRRLGDRNGEAVALDRLGTLLKEGGKLTEAEQSYRRSLDLSVAAESPLDVAATIANLGCLYVRAGSFEKAQQHLQDAVRRYREFDDPRAVSHVEYCLAQAAEGVGDSDRALDHVRRALEVVDQLRKTARTRGHYYRPIWLWQEYADFEVALLLRRYRESREQEDLERIFRAADLARARTLFEKVVETGVGVPIIARPHLRAEERRLQEELNRRGRDRIPSGGARSADDQSERDIRRLRDELDQIRAAIRVADPRHGANSPRSVTVESARQLLAPRTALLSYVLGDERSYLLTLDQSQLTAHELPPRAELESYARTFHRALRESRSSPLQWQLIAARLTPLLLPAEAIPPEVDRLILVVDGLLHYIPFATLVSPRNAKAPLVDDFELTYVPSVSILARLRDRGRVRRGDRVAVFADPVFDRQDDRFRTKKAHSDRDSRGSSGGRPQQDHLPRLQASEDEARAIADLAEPQASSINLGFDASRRRVLGLNLLKYDILHFATHAWIDERFPELSGLALSRFDPAGKAIESDLRLHEIHGLRLNAYLTVLSGCDTALGEHVRGNGIEGFAHGFLYAGSSRVLVSLWRVEDRAAAQLMAEFYRRLLAGGASPAAALRGAQAWLRGQPGREAPYYWAPFVLQGDD